MTNEKETSQVEKKADEITKNIYVVNVYTDGSCIQGKVTEPNDDGVPVSGCGGWAYVIVNKDPRYNLANSGGALNTTNARMELMAAYQAIFSITRRACINIYSDSEYVVGGLNNLERWEKNDWKTQAKNPVANRDLWEKILKLIRTYQHNIFPHWIKGHNNHPINELADKLAQHQSKFMAACLRKSFEHVLKQDMKNALKRSSPKGRPFFPSKKWQLKHKSKKNKNFVVPRIVDGDNSNLW